MLPVSENLGFWGLLDSPLERDIWALDTDGAWSLMKEILMFELARVSKNNSYSGFNGHLRFKIKSTMESKTFAETSARRYRIVDAEMFFFAKNWIQ
jgi:hypothetical protein